MTNSITDQLDALCAVRKAPIRLGSTSPFTSITTPVDPERLNFLNERWPLSDLSKDDRTVVEGLLKFGGQHTLVPPLEEDMKKLLHRGQLWGPTNKIMKGRQSQCHENSCLCWEANQDKSIFLATGYALSDDGLWRQHSWCVNPRARSIHVIETTEKRELYFGYVMTLDETLDFGYHNTDTGGLTVTPEARLRYPAEAESEPVQRPRERD